MTAAACLSIGFGLLVWQRAGAAQAMRTHREIHLSKGLCTNEAAPSVVPGHAAACAPPARLTRCIPTGYECLSRVHGRIQESTLGALVRNTVQIAPASSSETRLGRPCNGNHLPAGSESRWSGTSSPGPDGGSSHMCHRSHRAGGQHSCPACSDRLCALTRIAVRWAKVVPLRQDSCGGCDYAARWL